MGDNVSIELHAFDEYNQYVDVEHLSDMIHKDGGIGLVGMIGVQSNQFPRAIDLAERFLKHDVQVAIGGFHVSGILSMLKNLTPELIHAQKLGISFFAGEAEDERLDELLRDAYNRKLKPIYNYLNDMPNLDAQPIPTLDRRTISRTFDKRSTFDLGRGCPFDCSFCTIINVQGKKSRFRTVDDMEKILKVNDAIGINKFFLTDDNFARNKNWEEILDRIISLRDTGLKVELDIQVDTLCHKIPNFMKKCYLAGVDHVFIGLENINPVNLLSLKKPQNKIKEYSKMILAWKKYNVILIAGYIIGLPNDTRESIIQDIETIKRELAIDILYFTNITPLPGSEDHKKLYDEGIWMDKDLNKYDLNHRVTHHPKMSDEEWDQAFKDAFDTYYTEEHNEVILKRAASFGSQKKLKTARKIQMYSQYPKYYKLSALEGGIIRIKRRKERRPSFRIERQFKFKVQHLKN